MKKNTILKKIDFYEEKLTKVTDEFLDFIDSLDDEELSVMGEGLCDQIIDIIHESGNVTINEIREFVESEYEAE